MIKLIVVTPVLSPDDYFWIMKAKISRGGLSRSEFRHIIVGPEKIRKFFIEDSEVDFLPERPGTRGVFDAVVQGVEYGITKYSPVWCSYINADDVLLPDYFKVVEGLPFADLEYDLIYGNVQWINKDGVSDGWVSVWPHLMGLVSLFRKGVPPFTQQGAIFSVRSWRGLGGFDLNYKYIADSDFWFRFFSGGYTAKFFSSALAEYRIRPGQLSGNQLAVGAEHQSWLAVHRGTHWDNIIGSFWVVLFKLRFSIRYVKRVMRGKRLRARDATRAGSF